MFRLNKASIVTRLSAIFTILFLSTAIPIIASDVMMRFWAEENYLRPIGNDGKPIPETYAFYVGEYYPGAFESEAEAIPFDTVARILVKELENQNYVMSPNAAEADYILIIQWGQTTPESEIEELDFSVGDEENEWTLETVPEDVKRRNAQLLGATKEYNSWGSSISLKQQLVEEALIQDRYFINLFAVSMDHLRSRKESGEKIRISWECQLSVPVNDDEGTSAMRRMAAAGRTYFGQNMRRLTFVEEDLQEGVVTIEDIRYLDFDEKTDTTKATLESDSK
jgi:hypothetical protein